MHKLSRLFKSIGVSIKTSLEILLSLLLTCLVGPIFLTVWIINEIVRLFVSIILWIKFGRTISLVNDGADNVWHYQKPGNNRMCVIAMFSDDPIPPEDLDIQRLKFLRQVILKQLPCGKRPYEKLTKTFTRMFGYDCFREDEFDIANHVKMYPEKVGGGFYTEDEFLQGILPQLAQDMCRTAPQWEQVIISGVKCQDRENVQSVRCFRYHHGYMDGATANLMISHCMYDGSPEDFPYVINPLKELKVSKMKIFFVKVICVLSAAFTMVNTIYKAARLRGRFVTKTFTGNRHFGWSEKLDAGLLRQVKSATKVSAPTVLATATGSALRKMNEKFPTNNSLNEKEVVLGFINALLPYSSIIPKNQFTLTHFTLPIGEMSWMKRMIKVNEEVKKIPFDPSFYLTRFMFTCFGRFPSCLIQALMEDAGNPISFSNVPMTTTQVSLWGSQINDFAGWPPLVTNTGMGIIIMRFASHIRFLCVADEACISPEEMKFFLTSVANEMKQMSLDCSNKTLMSDIKLTGSGIVNVDKV